MKRMHENNSNLKLFVGWQTGNDAVNYSSMFGTDNEASEWDAGGALGYMQTTVAPNGDRLLFKPYIQNNIGMLVNFGKKIENIGLKVDGTDSSVLTADNCRANVRLNSAKREIAIDSNGKTLVSSPFGTELISANVNLLDLKDAFAQLINYWKGIGFEYDENDTLHIPAYALTPAATGCYIKKEYLPMEMWIRMDIPHIYQIPIIPLFGN